MTTNRQGHITIKSFGDTRHCSTIEELKISLAKNYAGKSVTVVYPRDLGGALATLFVDVNIDGSVHKSYGDCGAVDFAAELGAYTHLQWSDRPLSFKFAHRKNVLAEFLCGEVSFKSFRFGMRHPDEVKFLASSKPNRGYVFVCPELKELNDCAHDGEILASDKKNLLDEVDLSSVNFVHKEKDVVNSQDRR